MRPMLLSIIVNFFLFVFTHFYTIRTKLELEENYNMYTNKLLYKGGNTFEVEILPGSFIAIHSLAAMWKEVRSAMLENHMDQS